LGLIQSKFNLIRKDFGQKGTPIYEFKKKTHDLLNLLIECSFGDSNIPINIQTDKSEVLIAELEAISFNLSNSNEIFRIYLDKYILEINCISAIRALKYCSHYTFHEKQKLRPSIVTSIFKTIYRENIDLLSFPEFNTSLRFDGIYKFYDKNQNRNNILRFYEDKTVVARNISIPFHAPLEVVFNKDEELLRKGVYYIEHDNILFTTASIPYIVNYKGKVSFDNLQLMLNVHNDTLNEHSVELYKFEKLIFMV
jgi:hypothetical protein